MTNTHLTHMTHLNASDLPKSTESCETLKTLEKKCTMRRSTFNAAIDVISLYTTCSIICKILIIAGGKKEKRKKIF